MTTSDNPQYKDRLAKLQKWTALGIDPYGQRTDGLLSAAQARALHKGPAITPHDGQDSAKVAGRIVLYRDIGKLIFLTIQDSSARIQIGLAKQNFPDRWPQAKLLELGDIAWFEGKVGHTKTEEITIWANGFGLLAKALLPPPDKFHGLSDTELRYRQRYVDLFANPDSMDVFLFRSKMIDSVRDFLKQRQYIEVETPLLQSIAGGAAARPFITHHNALDIDLFLRISPELYLKRLLVGGMERVFDINRNFRNEGIDTTHNPEFTMLECYQAYSDLAGMMELTESLLVCLVKERLASLGKLPSEPRPSGSDSAARHQESQSLPYGRGSDNHPLHLQYGDRIIDYTPPFDRVSYADLFHKHVGIDMQDKAAVLRIATDRGLQNAAKKDHDVLVGELFEQLAEPELEKSDRPIFLYDYPAALCPLTKRKTGSPHIAERFELYIAGMELANAYTELNDPVIQQETFTRQLAGLPAEESMARMDDDYINALRHGMPPAGGLGIGIDRLAMLLTNRQSIRDVVLFPLLKPHDPVASPPAHRQSAEPSEAQMEADVTKLESDLAKVKATTRLRPTMFILETDGTLRIVDV
ncbi:MAG: lysine--tRNA ligase [Phycisphaerales bacterium]|nr:lysine--tRNA ligase [Phycisphaerales bacterium]